jgi:hypothetical protein
MARRSALLTYLKSAFLWRWNLLAAGAGVALALLSGHADVVLPLVAAAEVAYLGVISTHPHFRRVVDAGLRMNDTGVSSAQLMAEMRAALRPDAWERFETLRERCLALEKLAQQFRGVNVPADTTVSELQMGSLERLLWMFLKLLYSQDALQRFLKGINRDGLLREIALSEKHLQAVKEKQRDEKFARSLEDKLETLRQRLANYDKAAENREFLAVEIDRIEQKVNAISEMALNSRDSGDIAAQVDGIAAGISATEEAMRNLNVAPVFQHEEPPRLLSKEMN